MLGHAVLAVLALTLLAASPAADAAGRSSESTTRSSVSADGGDADAASREPSISDDGRFVAFVSRASNLTPEANPGANVYLRDWQAGTTTLVSVNGSGEAGDGSSDYPHVSDDGRFVAFDSDASNLPLGGGRRWVYLYDAQQRHGVSAIAPGEFSAISGDGRFVTFRSAGFESQATNDVQEIYRFDQSTGDFALVSVAADGSDPDSSSNTSAVSDDGRFVAFLSYATNLVPGDGNREAGGQGADVFVRDLLQGTTVRVSVADDGSEAEGASFLEGMSGDGRRVAFTSSAEGLTPADRHQGVDVFVRDLGLARTELVSAANSGAPANGPSRGADISRDGRSVAFTSFAANLVDGDGNDARDAFVRDLGSGRTTRVSLTHDGREALDGGMAQDIGDGGRFVAFTAASAFVAEDRSRNFDVFLRDRGDPPVREPNRSEQPRRTERLAGADRIGTAVEMSRSRFPGLADRVYLARADLPSDALAAGVVMDGPILLVPSCGELPDPVRAEVERVAPSTIVALGGRVAVCDELLASAAGGAREVLRLEGVTRTETAVRVSREVFKSTAGVVYAAEAQHGADALAAGSLQGGPVLLVPREGPLPDAVLEEVERLDPERVVALGGPEAIGDAALTELAEGRPSERIAGTDRIATAAAISRSRFPDQGARLARVYLARADRPINAVSGGVLTGGPFLLVPACGPMPDEVRIELDRLNPLEVVALGGPDAVCDELLDSAG